MSLIDKMKNLFTEDEEETIKSEMIQVEIPAPEIKMREELSDNPTVVSTNKQEDKTPVFFNDEDFKELEKPKEIKSSYLKEKPIIKKEEKKVFKPSPIISPVYGILDKNYRKEDIQAKERPRSIYDTASINLDAVRQKAYGTLEDDLENTMFGNNSILFKEEEKDGLLEELTDVIELDEDLTKEDFLMKNDDLFVLIDSMEEKGE